MMRSLFFVVLIVATGCLSTVVANEPATNAVAPAAAVSPNKHKPRLAVTVSVPPASEHNAENWEDLLLIELANQPFLELVDRQALQAVLKEHAIALSNLKDPKNALALGKFAGADYLLHVMPEKKTATIRLVEVATGQLKREESVTLGNDVALSAAAIREKVLAALRPDSQAANRLTVGITAFTNRSGTDRSDKLGIELQKALHRRLKDKAWAVVLERQYPTALLEEVDLARAGLARAAPDALPSADLVIVGTMQDVDNEYIPGKPWTVKLDLTLRLRGHSRQISKACRSDAVEAAADGIIGEIENLRRRQPGPQAAMPEKELWRRQAQFLMPRTSLCELDCRNERVEMDTLEMIRAWENVSLLDASDTEATMNLAICLVAISKWPLFPTERVAQAEKLLATARSERASRLLERVLKAKPTGEAVRTYFVCSAGLHWVKPSRSREMYQYVLDHPDQFKGICKFDDDFYVRTARWELVDNNQCLYPEIRRAVMNADKDPNSVFYAMRRGGHSDWTLGPLVPTDPFVVKNLESPNPTVRFAFQMAVAEWLCRQKHDPAALEHFDRAIEVMEAVYARSSQMNRLIVDHTYLRKIQACKEIHRPEEVKKTALAGAKHYMQTGRFDYPAPWLYWYCVTEVLGRGQEQVALAICDAYLAAAERNPAVQNDYGPHMFAKRVELLARLAGISVPSLDGLRLAKGTEATSSELDRNALRVAATERRLWLVQQRWQQWWQSSGGPARMYIPDLNETRTLTDLPVNIYSVATMKGTVFFGGKEGLYKLDTNGRLLKHYSREDGTLLAGSVMDLCVGGGKLYLCFFDVGKWGVAMLDPATDKVSVLAPSRREAQRYTEPVWCVSRVWWDVTNARLYASTYEPVATANRISRHYGWMQNGKMWKAYPSGEGSPRLIVSDADEALLVQILGKQTEFHFLKSGQRVTAEVPLPWLMGEPAWDEHRVWVPTYTGLYEVDRKTGRLSWLAHQQDTPFFSVLKQDGRLYIATGRGLYYRDIP